VTAAERARTIIGVKSACNLSMHNLGNVTAKDLISEAASAANMFNDGARKLKQRAYGQAMNLFFKSAAIAVNVVFTARVHRIQLPAKTVRLMRDVSARSAKAIAMLTSSVAGYK
jgi:hypothetical protein